MSKKVLVVIANGSEEIEFTGIANVLRRAKCDVTIASIHELSIVGARGIKITADKKFSDCVNETYDLIALPGGMPGAKHLGEHLPLIEKLKKQFNEGRFIAAICASPVFVFQKNNIAPGLKKTAYPSMLNELDHSVDEKVVVDKNCVTSQGPGTTLLFAVKLVELLCTKQQVKEIADDL